MAGSIGGAEMLDAADGLAGIDRGAGEGYSGRGQ